MSQLKQAFAFILFLTQIGLISPPAAYAQAEDTASPGPTADEMHQLVAPIDAVAMLCCCSLTEPRARNLNLSAAVFFRQSAFRYPRNA